MIKPVTRRRWKSVAMAITLVSSGCSGTAREGSLSHWLSAGPTLGQPLKQENAPLGSVSERELCLTTAARLREAGHAREALELYQKAESLDPRADTLDREIAPLLAANDQYAEAVARYQRALQRSPDDLTLRTNYGWTLMESGDVTEAEAQLRDVLRRDSAHAQARNNLAVLLARTERYDEAVTEFTTVMGPAKAHYNVGIMMLDQGHPELAESAFQRAAALPDAPPACQQFLAALKRG